MAAGALAAGVRHYGVSCHSHTPIPIDEGCVLPADMVDYRAAVEELRREYEGRMEILCGKRAMDYLSAVYEQDKAIGQKLSVKPVDTFAAVERLENELTSMKCRMTEMETELFDRIAENYADQENVLIFRNEMRPDSVRRLADTIAQKVTGLTAVFAGTGNHYSYALIRSDGTDINSFVKAMNATLSGRGGGRNGFAQGSAQAERADIEAFFTANQ